MAHVDKVMRSIDAPGSALCVDIFVRPEGTFGFEEYRRDAEDGRGWFPVGHFSVLTFASEDEALEAATKSVRWLAEVAGPADPDNR